MNISTKQNSLFWLFILACLTTVVRSLSWHNNFYNGDELEWIYLLNRIKVSCIPFNGFVAHTSGPLSIYYLSIINLFTDYPSLKALRIFQFLGCIIPTVYFLYLSISNKGKLVGCIFYFLIIMSTDNNKTLLGPYNEFFAYNTEFVIMLFISILYVVQLKNKLSIFHILMNSGLIICLFFIKSQAIIYCLFFTCIYFVQLFRVDRQKAILFLLFLGGLMFTIIVLFYYLHILDDFKTEYLYKNFLYAKVGENTVISQMFIIHRVLAHSLVYFWGVLFVVFGLIFLKFYRGNLSKQIFCYLARPILLFFTTLLILFVSKNNFTHYKILLFFPISLLIGELVSYANFSIKSIRIIIVFLIAGYFLFYSRVFVEIIKNLSPKRIEIYKSSMGMVPMLASSENPFLEMDHSVDVKERIQLFNFVNNFYHGASSVYKIYIFGWQVGQGLYYEFLKKYQPVSRYSNIDYLLNWHTPEDLDKFKKTEEKIIQDLRQGKPNLIINSEQMLERINGMNIQNFIKKNYRVVFQSKNFKVLVIQ